MTVTVNDKSDPEIVKLFERLEEYRQVANFGPERVDAERVMKLYKKDENFMAYDPAPPVGGFLGWEDYWVAYHQIFDKYRECKFDYNDDMRVVRKGDVSWSSVSAKIYGKSRDGAEFHKDVRGTLVWVKEDGEWLVAQEHWSATREIPLASGEVV